MIINDLVITGPYQVYDVELNHYVFSWLDRSAPGDIPPDIAVLPVKRTYNVGDVMIIETGCNA